MESLSEDPTFLAGGLGLLALGFLLALKVTQQGKYLVWAGAALGLALVVVVVEQLWVTDNERIEEAVYGLARAVAASDVPATLARLDDDVRFTRNSSSRSLSLPAGETRAWAEKLLTTTKFDFLRLTRLQTNAGGQSRRGTAEFQVLCGGSIEQGNTQYNFGSTHTSWSLGLRETSPGVWKVNRITPVELPRGENVLPR